MICHLRCIFIWIFFIPQPTDGQSVTWFEPTPIETTSDPNARLPPGIVQVYEGSSVTLNWSYSLTSGLSLVVIKFNGGGIVIIQADGSAGPVNAKFQGRFNVSSTVGRVYLLISPVNVSDDKAYGEFTCELIDTQTDIWKRAIQVKVLDGQSVTWFEPTPIEKTSDPNARLPPGILQVSEGSSVTLNWSYSLTPGLSLVVIKFNGGGIVNIQADGSAGPINTKFQERFNVSSIVGRVSLLISPVNVSDDKVYGEFTCELIDTQTDIWKRAIQVKVLVPINITGIRGEPTVLEGDSLQLICKVLSRVGPNITWTKEKPGNQGNTDVVQKGKVLTITNISRTDSGIYTCTASNGFGKQEKQTVHVDVTYPPKIVNFQPEYIVGVQQSVTLNCTAEGNPPPTYTWTPCDSEQVCDKNTLKISQVLNDANYTCRVANVYGDVSKTANVYVGGNMINITIVITSETCTDEKYNPSFLLEKLKELFKEAFSDKTGYEGVQLTNVRCGSITVDLALKFNSTTKEQDVIITLNGAVKDGKLGDFNVSSIKGTRPDVKPTHGGTTTPTDGCSKGFAWWIILIIVLAVVIVLVSVIILVKKKGSYCLPVKNGKRPRVHSDEGRGIATEADNQYAAAGPNVNYRASNPSSEPSVTYEVAIKSSEGRRGNKAGAPREQLPEYAVVDKTKKKKKTPKPGELQYAELGEITGRGQKGTMPRVSGTDTVYADIKS